MTPWWNSKYRKAKSKKSGKRRTLEEMGRKDLRDTLDREFSTYIRLKAADDSGLIRCPTCGQVFFWREMECSHNIHRDKMCVRWDERNVIAQCHTENHYHGGNVHIMRRVLINKYGEDAIKQIEDMAIKYGKSWLDDEFSMIKKIKEYRQKIKALKLEKGL